MRNLVKYIAMACVVLGMASCVQDLNTKPIDKHSTTGFNQNALFTKIYATLGTTGQQVPSDNGSSPDVDDIDEGWSGLYRVSWVLNEFPTDCGWWIWADPGVDQVRSMTWDGENTLINCLYSRCIIDVKYCNHFLAYADSTSQNDLDQRAEVRFIRALNYWYLLDNFKFIPYLSKESTDPNVYPDYYSRQDMYAWLEKELKELTTLLPAHRIQKYRVDQAAAWLLLARLYLNAEVYTGTPQWAKAQEAAEQALTYGYHLYETPSVNKEGITYSAYQKLFMADNDNNGAQEEAVLLVYQDGNYCRSYGAIQYVIAATRDGGMIPWGVSTSWKCFRTSPELVYKFFSRSEADAIRADEYHMPAEAKDDRAIFCSYVKKNPNLWVLKGGMAADFYASWACPKFTALYSTADSLKQVKGSSSEWPDTDLPLFRIAEAYMTKAEAMYRQGEVDEARIYINDHIRKRAGAAGLEKLDDATLCDEWCREFWGEGRRRIDLIRFNRFAGEKANLAQYMWEGRGNTTSYISLPEYYNWFPVPSADKKINPNFKKQVLEDPNNEYAGQGGDGYTYAN